jgi:hypothetical protein
MSQQQWGSFPGHEKGGKIRISLSAGLNVLLNNVSFNCAG